MTRGVHKNVKREATPIGKLSIIAIEKFIQSTRDSGYKETGSAIAELIDNSIQAGALSIDVTVATTSGGAQGEAKVAVADNGAGMDRSALVQALRFGGSTRFDDRGGMGRFGMGLPNASLSQAKRLTVYTWQRGRRAIVTYLDVDEVAAGEMVDIPPPFEAAIPDWINHANSPSGTVVVWEKCDRIEVRRISTITRRLARSLGQTFRYFISGSTRIRINEAIVQPLDPLLLNGHAPKGIAASPFGEPIVLEVTASESATSMFGKVEVRFSELPIGDWHDLSNDDKREKGISNHAGISIVRANREVDYGWFFMGSKRRENYDDWWRCEVRFDPILDEAFGISHTKQQIRPKAHLVEALQPHMEATAKALNSRVRQSFGQLKLSLGARTAETIAETKQAALRPIPKADLNSKDRTVLERVLRRNPVLRDQIDIPPKRGPSFKIVEDDLGDACLFRPLLSRNTVVSVLNPRHPFFKRVYEPLAQGRAYDPKALLEALQLLILAASRAELSVKATKDRSVIESFRNEWSETLEVMLR